MARRRRWSESEQRELLVMQAESGLSMFAFARAAEVSYSTLLSWVRRPERSTASSRIVPVEIAVHAPAPLAPHLEYGAAASLSIP
jgi:transposase-like protein